MNDRAAFISSACVAQLQFMTETGSPPVFLSPNLPNSHFLALDPRLKVPGLEARKKPGVDVAGRVAR